MSDSGDDPTWVTPGGGVPARSIEPPNTGVVAMFGENKREGRWWLPRHLRVLAVFGSATVDLREAQVDQGLSVIQAVAILGNIEIIVPPEIGVECAGDALAGSFELKFEGRATTAVRGDRIVRVTGSAFSGAVTVIVKGEPTEGVLTRLSRTLGIS